MSVGRQALAWLKHAVLDAVPPLADLDDGLRAMRNAEFRKRRNEEMRALERLRSTIGGRFANRMPAQSGKSVLIFGFGNVELAVIERIVAAAFEHAGMMPILIAPRFMAGRRAYKGLGLGKVRSFAPFVGITSKREAVRAIAKMTQEPELHAYQYNGVPCGKIALSSLMRSLRRGSFDLGDKATRNILVDALARSIGAVKTAQTLLAKRRPAALVLSDRGYTPFGEFFNLCVADGIPVYTWNIAHRYGLIVMKRFGKHNTHVHHHSLSPESWAKILKLEWRDAYRNACERELTDSYTSGEWYGEVGTQFHVSSIEKEALVKRLALDASKKTAVIFPHIFWDGTFFWGDDLFDDYEQWFRAVIKVARENNNLNWVVKVHPANVVKDARDKFSAEHSEITTLREELGGKPDHIQLVEASSDISTLSLFSIMDYCLTVRGTIGIEAAYRGIPVLTAGTGRYDRLGFTVDFDDKETYLSQLAKLETVPPLTPAQWDLAKKYAFGVFALRPTRISSVTFSFRKDAVASLDATITVANDVALKSAPDIVTLGDWIQSGEDDFCNWGLAEQAL